MINLKGKNLITKVASAKVTHAFKFDFQYSKHPYLKSNASYIKK